MAHGLENRWVKRCLEIIGRCINLHSSHRSRGRNGRNLGSFLSEAEPSNPHFPQNQTKTPSASSSIGPKGQVYSSQGLHSGRDVWICRILVLDVMGTQCLTYYCMHPSHNFHGFSSCRNLLDRFPRLLCHGCQLPSGILLCHIRWQVWCEVYFSSRACCLVLAPPGRQCVLLANHVCIYICRCWYTYWGGWYMISNVRVCPVDDGLISILCTLAHFSTTGVQGWRFRGGGGLNLIGGWFASALRPDHLI